MAVQGVVRGQYAKTAARRRDILLAGFAVFATSGYRTGSIREIADRVGMSQAGLMHHFPSKSDLLAGVLELRDDDARQRVPLEGAPGIEMIRGLAYLVDYNATIRGLVELHCILSAEATDPEHPAHQYFRNRYTWSVQSTADAFEDMRVKGQLKPGIDPLGSAKALIALMDGLQVQWLLDAESVDMGLEVRRSLRTLMAVPL